MRCIVAASILAIPLFAMPGCGKPPASAAAITASKPPVDPTVSQRESDEQAAFSIDAACASIEQALAETKKLAPVAGGDAKEALLNVAEMFDSAGATLADHNEPPPPADKYRQESAERAGDRQRAVTDALDALHELRDARGILGDLASNVPPEHAKPLLSIQAQTEEAIDAVQDAIGRLGGKVPPEEAPPSDGTDAPDA